MKKRIPDILKKIVDTKRRELTGLDKTLDDFIREAADAVPALDFKESLRGERLSVIAEIKKASPSVGNIVTEFKPQKIAAAYAEGGASAISVLTDEVYFKGSLEYLRLAKNVTGSVPVLRKDFIIDPLQVYQARAAGADTFLLIAAILETKLMSELLNLGRELGMEPLVEAHTDYELESALEAGAKIVGVNNRNLHDFSVDLSTAEKLSEFIPEGCISVAESGVKTPFDAERMRQAGYDAVLVGEALMREGIEKCADMIYEISKYRR